MILSYNNNEVNKMPKIIIENALYKLKVNLLFSKYNQIDDFKFAKDYSCNTIETGVTFEEDMKYIVNKYNFVFIMVDIDSKKEDYKRSEEIEFIEISFPNLVYFKCGANGHPWFVNRDKNETKISIPIKEWEESGCAYNWGLYINDIKEYKEDIKILVSDSK